MLMDPAEYRMRGSNVYIKASLVLINKNVVDPSKSTNFTFVKLINFEPTTVRHPIR